MILGSKAFDVEYIDISSNPDAKQKMRQIVGDPNALPPQICRGDKYLGVCSFSWMNYSCEVCFGVAGGTSLLFIFSCNPWQQHSGTLKKRWEGEGWGW